MPLMAHQTTHKVEERISELNDRSIEIFQSIETETQREKIMGEGISNKLTYVALKSQKKTV